MKRATNLILAVILAAGVGVASADGRYRDGHHGNHYRGHTRAVVVERIPAHAVYVDRTYYNGPSIGEIVGGGVLGYGAVRMIDAILPPRVAYVPPVYYVQQPCHRYVEEAELDRNGRPVVLPNGQPATRTVRYNC